MNQVQGLVRQFIYCFDGQRRWGYVNISYQLGLRDLVLFPLYLFPYSLIFSSLFVCISLFDIPMPKLWGKHSCMRCTFSVAKTNAILAFSRGESSPYLGQSFAYQYLMIIISITIIAYMFNIVIKYLLSEQWMDYRVGQACQVSTALWSSAILVTCPLYFFPYSLFSSCFLLLCLSLTLFQNVQVLWTTLVIEFHISYGHAEWYLLSSFWQQLRIRNGVLLI